MHMNKKTVSWAASVMMAGSLAAAPFAGAQMGMGDMSGGQYGGGQHGPGMMGEDSDMFDRLPFDIERVLQTAANKNIVPEVCRPDIADIKAGDEDAIDNCLAAVEDQMVEILEQDPNASPQKIGDATNMNAMMRAGGVSRAKRVIADGMFKVGALEAKAATSEVEGMIEEQVGNIAQRQEGQKAMRAARQQQSSTGNSFGSMDPSMMGGSSGMGMDQRGFSSTGPMDPMMMMAGGRGGNSMMGGTPGVSGRSMGMPGMGGTMFGQGSSAKSPEDAARMAREMFRPTTENPEFTPLMEQQAKDGFAMMQSGSNGSNTAGAWQSGGANQQGQGPRQPGMPGNNGQGGYGPFAQVTPGGQNRGPQDGGGQGFGGAGMGGYGGMYPGAGVGAAFGPGGMMSGGMPGNGMPGGYPPGGVAGQNFAGTQPSGAPGAFTPPQGGAFGQNFAGTTAGGTGAFTPPPGGSTPPPPQGGTQQSSAIGTLGVGFWKGFFKFLGF